MTVTTRSFLSSRKRLHDVDAGVGGNAIGERPFVADEFVADEDIDVLAQRALFVDDIVAQPAPALVDGADGFGDGGCFDLEFGQVGEEALQVGCEFDPWHVAFPWIGVWARLEHLSWDVKWGDWIRRGGA